MSDAPRRRHALDSFLDRRRDIAEAQQGLQVRVQPALDYTNLRGKLGDAAFVTAVESLLQQSLPVCSNTLTSGPQTIYWLGPDEWLIVTEADAGIYDRLSVALESHVSGVTPQNGGLIQMTLSGEFARDVLAKGCTLDLHTRAFQVGQCAQTGLAKADVLLALTDNMPSFNLIVRRSFAEYIALWLAHSGSEFGVEFSQQS